VDSIYPETKSNGVWQKNELDIITRDASCGIVSSLSFTWDESTQSWINSFLYTYSSGNNANTEILAKSWDALNNASVNYSNAALVNGQTERMYTYQMCDAGSNAWINNYRSIDELEDQGRSVVSQFDFYYNNEWQKGSKRFEHIQSQ
jgi:hypothetical protein